MVHILLLKIFKELTERNEIRLLSLLTGHKLFKYFVEKAEKVDPRKQVD